MATILTSVQRTTYQYATGVTCVTATLAAPTVGCSLLSTDVLLSTPNATYTTVPGQAQQPQMQFTVDTLCVWVAP